MSAWQRVVLMPTGFAEEAVAVFFVLSGYLVGGQVIRQVREGRFSWREYLIKRVSRMWVVLLPALLLTLAADSLSRSLFTHQFGIIRGPGELDVATSACNAAFLQSTRCHAYGSNDALWSLSFEFWFYVLFAGGTVTALSLVRRSWQSFAVGALVSFGSIAVFGWPIFRLIFAWLLGVAVAVLHGRWKTRGIPAWVHNRLAIYLAMGLAGAGAITSAFFFEAYELRFAAVGLTVSPLILVLAAGKPYSPPWIRASGKTGDWSFSIYAYHLPILKLLIAAFTSAVVVQDAKVEVAVYVLGVLVVIACVPLWYITEKRTPKVRDWLMKIVVTRKVGTSGSP